MDEREERQRDGDHDALEHAEGATPRKAAIDSDASTLPIRHRRATEDQSNSELAATITTAASVADGKNAVTDGARRMNTTIANAPTTEHSCVLAPACSATGVREDDAEIGKPPSNPPATFETPIADISWLPFTVTPRRAAKVRESTPVSVNAISAIPSAGSASEPTSDKVMPPSAGAASPAAARRRRGSGPPARRAR